MKVLEYAKNNWIIIVLVILVVNLAIKVGSRERDTVYSMCQESRTTNKVTEETCGELQTFYEMEYLCKDRNPSTSNKCWVEEK